MMTQTLDLTSTIETINAEIDALGKGGNGGLIAEARNGRIWVGDDAIGETFDADEDGAAAAFAAVRDWTSPQADLAETWVSTDPSDEEIGRRVAKLDAGTAQTVDAEEVLARIAQRRA